MKMKMKYLNLLLLLFLTYILSLVSASKTIVDRLSEDARFSSLLHQLQNTRLIPYLNSLKIATLFAPTNDAFDNVDLNITKEILLYHVLPIEFKVDEFYDGQVLETALVKKGYLGDGDVGQRVKVEKPPHKDVTVGGSRIINKDIKADNGIIQVVDRVLVPPEDLSETISSIPSLEKFVVLLSLSGVDSIISKHKPFTIFAPESSAVARINPVEADYLKSKYGREDLETLVQYHIHKGAVFSEDVIGGRSNLSTLEGESLDVLVDKNNDMYIDDAEVEKRDIIASNGAIHTISSVLRPDAVKFSARKYLFGLNITRFISFIDDAGLSHYIDDTTNDTSYTILAPHDDAFREEDLPAKGTKELERWMRYHILPKKIHYDDLRDGLLLETELRGKDLKGANQRLKVGVEEREVLQIWADEKTKMQKDVRFNDAGLVREPVTVNDNIIYVISQVLSPPPPIINSLVTNLDLSTFIAFLYASGLDNETRHAPGVTVFVPTNNAFEELGLVTRYLLLPEFKKDLQSVVQYHIADRVLYTAELSNGTTKVPTLDDTDLIVNKTKDGEIFVHPTGNEEYSRPGQIDDSDILVSTGVVHIIDSVVVPPTLKVTNRDLLRGVRAQTMLDILKIANISSVLDAPADNDHKFTVLVPSDKAFARVNLSRLLNDQDMLNRVARLHVIPHTVEHGDEGRRDNRSPRPLKDGAEYSTLLSDDDKVVVREVDTGSFYIEVAGQQGKNSAARVIGIGRSMGGGGVIEIDQVLIPHDNSNGGLPAWAIALIVIAVAAVVGVAAYYLWDRYRRHQGYDRVD